MTYYAALDVSLRSVNVCIVNDAGDVKFEAKVVSEVQDILTCLGGFDGEISQVGFEAGGAHSVFDLRFASGGI